MSVNNSENVNNKTKNTIKLEASHNSVNNQLLLRQRRRTKSVDIDHSNAYSHEDEDSGDESETSTTDVSTTSNDPGDRSYNNLGASNNRKSTNTTGSTSARGKQYSSVKLNPKYKNELRKVNSAFPGNRSQNQNSINSGHQTDTSQSASTSVADSNQTLVATSSSRCDVTKDLERSAREMNRPMAVSNQSAINSIGKSKLVNKKSALTQQISAQLSTQKFALNTPEPIMNLKASKSITHTDGVGAMMEEFKTKYEVTGIIGRGGGGTVYSGYRRSDKLSVAIKQVPKQKIKRWGTIYGFKVPIEFDLLYRVQNKHHSIIEMMDWYERRTSYVMVMERPPHSSDLFEYINRKGAIAENNARFIIKQLIEVMIICLKENVFHRDIKDENIMINYYTYRVWLGNFF